MLPTWRRDTATPAGRRSSSGSVSTEWSANTWRFTIGRLAARGAEGIILGCTEITLLVDSGDSPVPLYDTTAIHAEAAVDWMLA